MAKKDRLWIMVDVNFWETEGADLTVEARDLWLRCLAFSKKHRTDGVLTRGQLEVLVSPLLLRSNGDDPTAGLVTACLLLDEDGASFDTIEEWKKSCGPFALRGWFDWNASAEQIAKKSEAGRKNAQVRWVKRAKANGKANGKANARVKSVENRDREIETDKATTSSPPTATGSRLGLDPFKDALFTACFPLEAASAMTKIEWKKFNDAATAIKAVGGTPEDVVLRAAEWHSRDWPDITPSGLASNWAALSTPGRPRARSTSRLTNSLNVAAEWAAEKEAKLAAAEEAKSPVSESDDDIVDAEVNWDEI